jgi:hypothetical protein
MKSFSNFCTEAYDAAFMSGAQTVRTGEGGRIGAERRKTAPERTRTKRGEGGTTLPAEPYKPRKDTGISRPASTRVQQPTQERGSKDVLARAAAAAREESRKAAKARAAAKNSGQDAPKAKPKTKELERKATQILSNKKEAEPKGEKDERTTKYQYTRKEKKRMVQAGKRLEDDIKKGRDKPAAHYQPKTDPKKE